MISALALAPLLAACSSEDDKPKVDPSASSYGTLRVGIGALREMRAVAYLYAQALRNVGYNVEVVTNEDSRSKFLDALKQTEANTPEPDTLDLVVDYSGDVPRANSGGTPSRQCQRICGECRGHTTANPHQHAFA